MKTDDELRRDVERELESEPAHDHRTIGVSVVDRVVTLTGYVSSYAQRWKGPSAPCRESRVRGVANDLRVRRGGEPTETDIAKAALAR
jgi:osmotically-inducible protein OsmY